jgi:hypothetical protein
LAGTWLITCPDAAAEPTSRIVNAATIRRASFIGFSITDLIERPIPLSIREIMGYHRTAARQSINYNATDIF